jgi:ACS family hexuronate transporter-like MFS transporter
MICRICLGFTEAGNWPCGIRTTRTVLPPEERSFGNALFQSGTAIGAIITPLIVLACYEYYGETTPGIWVVPFRAIGLIGFLWVFLWFLAVPNALFEKQEDEKKHQPFHLIFKDRRFWVLIFVILGANSAWHTIRVWLPRMLDENWRCPEREIQFISSGYYLCADVGSWSVGLATLFLARSGFDLSRVRVKAFALCTIILTLAVMQMVNAESKTVFLISLMIAGFAALGLFPTYFALSQDLSAKHQGKVTGLLGCINALLLAGMFRLQGPHAKDTADYDVLIMLSTLPPIVASILLIAFWKTLTNRPANP